MTPEMTPVYRMGEAIWERDPEYRTRMETDPRAALAEQGVEIPESLDVRVVVNDASTMHIVFPPDPNETLLDEALSSVNGGIQASSAATVTSASTLGSIPSTVSSAATASTLSSARPD